MKWKVPVLFLITITIASYFSCKKEPVDFRDQFIGKYQVKEQINCYGSCATCASEKDTLISVRYGMSDSSLSVLGRDIKLDINNFYYAYHYGLWLGNDSIYSKFMYGGLGCGQYEIYEGVRVSKKP
jgi:hypothetical protein